jgi:hypothetical protein
MDIIDVMVLIPLFFFNWHGYVDYGCIVFKKIKDNHEKNIDRKGKKPSNGRLLGRQICLLV